MPAAVAHRRVAVLGNGGHARVVLDAIREGGQQEVDVFDDGGPSGSRIRDLLEKDPLQFVVVVAIGDNGARLSIADKASSLGFRFLTVAHPRAVLARDVELGEGCVVFAGAIINPGCRIGPHAIINTAAVVDHDTTIGRGAHIAPGARLAGSVTIGDRSLIGVGACIHPNRTIARDVIVGVGGVVIADLTESGTYVGNPVRKI